MKYNCCMMKTWLAFGLIIVLLKCAECQEPDDSATRKYQNELFKAETTETTNSDINTTLSSTEIENNSTATESSRTNDEVDAANDLDENDELSSTRDTSGEESANQFETSQDEEVTQSNEWTTLPEEHEYSISIKDVFEKSMDVVKDEMKGIGIIQSWLKEQANEFVSATTKDDYDYTQTTDEYTNVNEIYDDDETGVTADGQIDNAQKENELGQEDLPPNDNELDMKKESSTEAMKFAENTNALEAIENDLEKLNKVQAQEEQEVEEREELIKDIEKNLNKLEASSSHETTNENIDTDVTTTEGLAVLTTAESISDEEEETILNMNVGVTEATTTLIENKLLNEDADNIITTTELPIVEEKETLLLNTDVAETTTVFIGDELPTEQVESVEYTEILFEVESTELPTTENKEEEDSTVLISIDNEIETNESSTIIPITTEQDEININIIDERIDMTTENIDDAKKQNSASTVTSTSTGNTNILQIEITTTEASITTEVISPITEGSPITENHSFVETTNAPSTTTEATQQTTLSEEQYNSEEFLIVTQISVNDENSENNKDRDITLEIIPVRKIEERNYTTPKTTELPLTTVDYHNSHDIVDEVIDEVVSEVVDEIIDDIQDSDITSTTTISSDPTKVLMEETVNLTKTINDMVTENEKIIKVLTSNSIDNTNDKNSDELLSEENQTDINESIVDILESEGSQEIEIDGSMTSSEEEVFDDFELDRKKILADHNRSEKDNTLGDVDHNTKPKEDVAGEVADPKVSAFITDRMNGNVCLNASGLSIKITTNNLTRWVPQTAKVSGECTSFGAYLNLTWKSESKEIKDNYTLSFTFIGDHEEAYIEEVILKTNKGSFVTTQQERYFTEPTIINMSQNTTLTMTHLNIKLNRTIDDYATISLLNVDNALALQIASGGLCLFIVLIGVSIYSYRKLRSQARIFKVSLDK